MSICVLLGPGPFNDLQILSVFVATFYLAERGQQKLSGQINEKLWERQEMSYMLIVLQVPEISVWWTFTVSSLLPSVKTKQTESKNIKYCSTTYYDVKYFCSLQSIETIELNSNDVFLQWDFFLFLFSGGRGVYCILCSADSVV